MVHFISSTKFFRPSGIFIYLAFLVSLFIVNGPNCVRFSRVSAIHLSSRTYFRLLPVDSTQPLLSPCVCVVLL